MNKGDTSLLSVSLRVAFLLFLPVISKEACQPLHGVLQNLHTGQIDHAEMIRLLPVKAATVNDQKLFFFQEIQGEFFVVRNVKALGGPPVISSATSTPL